MLYPSSGPVLIIEDSDEDYEIIQWALKKLSIRTPIARCVDGDDALDYLYKRGEYAQKDILRPALVLLDLGLTAMDGYEVLSIIKQDEQLKAIPVIIWTSSSDPKDVDISFKQGANSYMLKSMNLDRLLQSIEMLNQFWFGVAVLPTGAE